MAKAAQPAAGLKHLAAGLAAEHEMAKPATGEPIKSKASKKIAFRPAKELKQAA